MAVAIWDHEPSADELLARRLERGWTPTPSATRDGDVVLGFAAKAKTCRAGSCQVESPLASGARRHEPG
jgi:hypothetical protein